MRFKMSRVSDSDVQPCPEAKWASYQRVATNISRGELWMTCEDGEASKQAPINGWKDSGDTNFYGEPIYKGEFVEWGWVIDVDTLEQLMALIREHGSLIVEEDAIIIYDDYL